MSVPESEHKVYMFKNDYDALRAKVSTHRHSETGGNLFGLWTTSGSAVIHFILGSGRFANADYTLCHIGEWYHLKSLNQLSTDVEQAVKRNFPQGMSKYLVIVANDDSKELSPFFFTDRRTHYEKSEFVFLKSDNPFSKDAELSARIERGAEQSPRRDFETLRNAGSCGSYSHQNVNATLTYSQVASRSSHGNSRQTGSITQSYGNTSSTHSQATRNDQQSDKNANDEKATTKEIIMKNTYDELEKFFGKGKVEMERSDDDINMIFEHSSYNWMVRFPENFPTQRAKLYRVSQRYRFSSSFPCHDYNLEKPLTNHVNILLSIKKNCRMTCEICENMSKENLTPEDGPTSFPVDDTAQTTINPPKNGSAEVQTTEERLMKDIYDELEKFFGEGKVEIERKSSGIDMMFEHEFYHWMVRFPKNFPTQPAKLYRERERRYFPSSSSASDLYNLEKPLTNGVNILLSIKKNCSYSCKICKNINKEKLTKPPAAVPPVKITSAEVVTALTNEIKMTEMTTPLSFFEQAQDDGSHKIEFTHYCKNWSIKIPADFPDKPAEVYKQESCFGAPARKRIRNKQEQKLVSPDLIMSAIRSNCYCSPCRNNTS